MQRLFVIDRNLVARLNISQSKKKDVTVERSHKRVRLAGMIDVVSSIAATSAVQTPAPVDIANAQHAPVACALLRFQIVDSFARVLSDLFPAEKRDSREAAFAVDL